MITGPGQDNEPCFVMGVAVRMVGVHAQTLRYYERVGLVAPSRSFGKRRLYSQRDIERIRRIKTLTDDLGINLAGVEVVLRLMDKMNQMDKEIGRLREEVKVLRQVAGGPGGRT